MNQAKMKSLVKRLLLDGMLFKIVFLLFALFSFNNFSFGQPIMSVFVWVTTVLGGILLLHRLLHFKNYIGTPLFWLLLAFCISYIISVFLNMEYGGTLQSIKDFVWMAFQFFILFVCDKTREPEDYKREYHILSAIYLIYMTIAAIGSMILLFIGDDKSAPIANGTKVFRGLVWGRLWGVFTDPNYGSILAVIAIVLSVYLITQFNRKIWTVLGSVSIVLQLFYISFSNSRTGLVGLALSIGFLVFSYLIRWDKLKLKNGIKQAVCGVIAVCVMGVLVILPSGITTSYNNIVNYYYQNQNPENPDIESPYIIGRSDEDTTNTDVSNKRFDLWDSSIKVFKTAPVFGVSFQNLIEYCLQNQTDNYLVDNGSSDYFENFHNMYFNVLAGQGIVGIIIIGAFSILVAIYVLRRAWKIKGRDYYYLIQLISVVIASACCMLFVSDVIYVNSGTAFMFWACLGYAVHLLKNKECSKELI